MAADQTAAILAARRKARTITHVIDGVTLSIELPSETEFIRAMSGSGLVVDHVPFVAGQLRGWEGMPMAVFQEGAPLHMNAPFSPELATEWLEDNFKALNELDNLIIKKHLERKAAKGDAAKNLQPGSKSPKKKLV